MASSVRERVCFAIRSQQELEMWKSCRKGVFRDQHDDRQGGFGRCQIVCVITVQLTWER